MTPVVATIRVIYGDTDMMGVAYYGNYLRWFEVGRNELIRARGMTYRQFEDRGLILPVVEASVKYWKSALYDDVLEIHTTVAELSRVRMGFEYVIRRGEDRIATGTTMHACLSKAGKPSRIPDDVADMLRR